ncbi:hypothetical protein OUZ56_014055 [Daphnia magna]|uniref:Uncharacterized protein n=1 Tax=Daphnia magna TaxID=35525 RepID=A0ABQ9Z8E0_9CRUS|nr:hypothetical protein OUZ56_014055 [Daphnia magna]
MPSSGLMQLSNGSSSSGSNSSNNSTSGIIVINGGANRMDGTLSQSMDSVNTVAAEEEAKALKYV